MGNDFSAELGHGFSPFWTLYCQEKPPGRHVASGEYAGLLHDRPAPSTKILVAITNRFVVMEEYEK
jgi:hypothetical protein